MSEKDPRFEPVLIRPGAFNRKMSVRENVLLAILPPYVTLARTMAGATWRKRRLDWGGAWDVSDRKGGFSITGPAIGAPNAVIMIETLIANGAKRIIVVGCCGSICEKVKIGDLLIPSNALSEEGTSSHYAPDSFPPEADKDLTESLKATCEKQGWPCHSGAVWTTDAPYRETQEKVGKYGGQGIMGVEMELSALFTVARFRGAKLASILAVSDELASLEWKPGFFRPSFLSATRKAIRVAINTLKSIS